MHMSVHVLLWRGTSQLTGSMNSNSEHGLSLRCLAIHVRYWFRRGLMGLHMGLHCCIGWLQMRQACLCHGQRLLQHDVVEHVQHGWLIRRELQRPWHKADAGHEHALQHSAS